MNSRNNLNQQRFQSGTQYSTKMRKTQQNTVVSSQDTGLSLIMQNQSGAWYDSVLETKCPIQPKVYPSTKPPYKLEIIPRKDSLETQSIAPQPVLKDQGCTATLIGVIQGHKEQQCRNKYFSSLSLIQKTSSFEDESTLPLDSERKCKLTAEHIAKFANNFSARNTYSILSGAQSQQNGAQWQSPPPHESEAVSPTLILSCQTKETNVNQRYLEEESQISMSKVDIGSPPNGQGKRQAIQLDVKITSSRASSAQSSDPRQLFSFSKTPKFGKTTSRNAKEVRTINLHKTNLAERKKESSLALQQPMYFSNKDQQPTKVDAPVNQEWKSEGDHRFQQQSSVRSSASLVVGGRGQQTRLRNEYQAAQVLYKPMHMDDYVIVVDKDYSTLDRCEQQQQQSKMFQRQSLEEEKLKSLKIDHETHKRGRSDFEEVNSQKVSMITKDIQPLETPSIGPASSNFHKTQTDSIQQSIDLTNDSLYNENRDVRETYLLKNPFFRTYHAEEALPYTPNRSHIMSNIKKRSTPTSSSIGMQRSTMRTIEYYQSSSSKPRNATAYLTQNAENGDFVKKYKEEKKKHESTKRALNKAIKLANLLLDQITSDNKTQQDQSRAWSRAREAMSSQDGTINFETKRQDLTPYQPRLYKDTISTENDPPKQDTFSPSRAEADFNFFGMQRKLYAFTTTTDSNQHQNISSLSPHSTVSRQKSASKELSDLTNLIRKSSKNPVIKNAKAVEVHTESTSTTLSRHLKQVFNKVNTQMKIKGLLQQPSNSVYEEIHRQARR